MIASLMGTHYQPDITNAILFLDDLHRIDRMLTTLALGACSTRSPASSSAAAATAG